MLNKLPGIDAWFLKIFFVSGKVYVWDGSALRTYPWAALSSIIIHWSFNHSVGSPFALDNSLDMFHCFRGKKLLSSFFAYSCRHIFDNSLSESVP
jgi:hypothetical protein